MQQQPQQPTPITDEEIIDLARAYDGTSPARRKNTEDYLRDGTYYTNGYVRLRMRGLTHEQAREIFLSTAERDAYYDLTSARPDCPGWETMRSSTCRPDSSRGIGRSDDSSDRI